MRTRTLGFGRIELIVGIACLIIVVVVAVMVLRASHPDSVWHEGDVVNMRGIHQTMLISAHDHNGRLPTPSHLVAGNGTPDPRHDTTANMYSLMVTQNLIAPSVLVSDREPNTNVRVFELSDELLQQQRNTPWIRTFQANLNRVSNVSYAHMYMIGERFQRYWRDTTDVNTPILSNRGPADGVRERHSLTTDNNGRWSGYVLAGDHSSQLQTSMTPAWLTFGEEDDAQPDNLFAIDDGLHGRDVVLTFTKNNSPGGAELHHD